MTPEELEEFERRQRHYAVVAYMEKYMELHAVVRPLAARWRAEAAGLRHRGMSAQADTLETCADILERVEPANQQELNACAVELGFAGPSKGMNP